MENEMENTNETRPHMQIGHQRITNDNQDNNQGNGNENMIAHGNGI